MSNEMLEIEGIKFFVSPEGDDSWSGKLGSPNSDRTDGPFATLVRARDAIRELKREGIKEPITVLIRGGRYFLKEPIVFSQGDSGTKDCPITYMAYPGEHPIISGGQVLKATWRSYKDGIMVCNVGKMNFNQLFVNGSRQTRARIPREGQYYYVEQAISPTSFRYKEGEFKRWRNLNDVEVVLYHSWNETRFRVLDVDEDDRIVKFIDPKSRHVIGWEGAGGPNRYYIDNVFEGLQQPGDWYLDRNTGELYYWPIGDIETLDIVVPVLKELMRLEGGLKEQNVQYITFKGITFCDTDWTLPENGYPDCGDVGDIVHPSAITWNNARYCSMVDCRIKNVGTYGLEITGYGNNVINNEICYTGSGGIISRNYDEERNVFSYNHIHHCGSIYPSGVGINIDDGGGTISHNLIHDISHSGIYTRHWATETQPIQRSNQEQGLLIEYNEIYNVMTDINDGGGIFIRDSNIIVRNNLIHDCYAHGGRCPGWGIYLGCETRDTIVENNIVYRADEVIHVWYSDRNCIIQNNILVDGRLDQINYQNPRERSHENIKLLRNIIYYRNSSPLFIFSHERCLPTESDYNVFFCTVGGVVIRGIEGVNSFADWQAKGFDKNSIVADPMFVDPENDNYDLKPESPAFKLGFKKIDMSKVGRR